MNTPALSPLSLSLDCQCTRGDMEGARMIWAEPVGSSVTMNAVS
jgi:hypothetical protein